MTFNEKYHIEHKWSVKVAIIELYHLAKCNKYKEWTQDDTAKYFNISVASVNENLKLAEALHMNNHLADLSRNKALRFVRYGAQNVNRYN